MNVIETKDCYGTTVTCSADRWNTHIISGHPELVGKEHIVAQTIADPKVVVPQSSDRTAYYNNDSKSIMPPLFTKVVVQFSNKDGIITGTVTTAFVSRNMGKIDENAKIDVRRI